MQVKKFEAPTIAEALKLVKSELGPEAVILSTKNNRKGFGLLSKASVEITAAVAEKSLAKKSITEKVVPQETKEKISKLPASKQAKIFDEFSDHYTRRYQDRMAAKEADRAGAGLVGRTSGPPRYIDISDDEETSDGAPEAKPAYGRNGRIPAKEVHADADSERIARATRQADLADSSLQDEFLRLKQMLEEIKSEQTAMSDARLSETTGDAIQAEYQNLLRNGIDKRYAGALVKQVSLSLSREAAKVPEKVVEALAVELMNSLKMDHPLDFKAGSEKRVFALIGPTGVGKTTTIAKLASQAILNKNLRVGLINVDSYKVAALDQLATYAKILNVPFRQAGTAAELDRALAEFRPLDLVLIDTSGRSQRDSEALTQMKNLLAESPAVRPLLIMSATTRDQELYDIITRFKIFNPTGVIMSKLDESSTFGCVYNVAMRTSLPLTYFTLGQRVPEDIEPASRERVADLILDL